LGGVRFGSKLRDHLLTRKFDKAPSDALNSDALRMRGERFKISQI
jgi:hypothetical protein